MTDHTVSICNSDGHGVVLDAGQARALAALLEEHVAQEVQSPGARANLRRVIRVLRGEGEPE